MALNLHGLVNSAISALHPNTKYYLYRASGEYIRGARGDLVAEYLPPIQVEGQMQSLGGDTLQLANNIEYMTVQRKLYVFSNGINSDAPSALYRPLSKAGDYLKDMDGQWWRVTSLLEDYTRSGWICLQVTFQTTDPKINVKEEAND